ncbi:phospholipase D family protein [Yoonia sp. SS1-5]|uniref:Phospholipase D n=1 Tax=Yoonia rhodophyticola TaxID=3137370 RepID=A0AAN0M9W6_9RHOB
MGRRFDILLTAQEAFPALEQQFLAARTEIIASFRIFDPDTTLRSAAAQQVGRTWSDLIAHTLDRGVKVTLTISDFDPVIRPDNHRYTWTCIAKLRAAASASQNPSLLDVSGAMHPARVGLLPRLFLWPKLIKQLGNALDGSESLHNVPGLRALTRSKVGGPAPRLFPPPPLVPASHHQKLAVFDDNRLYIGGLDLNERRYDTPDHAQSAEETWHDVQVIVDGPVVQEASAHLRNFQAQTAGKRPTKTTRLLRTISARRKVSLPYLSPRNVVQELADMHYRQISQARDLIYLESQFFRDRNLARHLAKRPAKAPGLSLIVILPVAAEDAAFQDEPASDVAYGDYLQTKCIEIVRRAFGDRVFIGSPLQPRTTTEDGRATDHGAPLVYLHAKVSIFDDRCGIVSSANLNGRSMGWDTEAGIATETTDEVAELKQRCFAHWLGPNADPACFDTKTACDAWAAHAARNAQTAPEKRQGFILPHSAGAAASFGYNLPGVPEEMV